MTNDDDHYEQQRPDIAGKVGIPPEPIHGRIVARATSRIVASVAHDP